MRSVIIILDHCTHTSVTLSQSHAPHILTDKAPTCMRGGAMPQSHAPHIHTDKVYFHAGWGHASIPNSYCSCCAGTVILNPLSWVLLGLILWCHFTGGGGPQPSLHIYCTYCGLLEPHQQKCICNFQSQPSQMYPQLGVAWGTCVCWRGTCKPRSS